MLDINPLSFIGQMYATGKAQKWWRLVWGCSVAAFIGFFGGFSVVGASVIAATHSPWLALTTGFFAACGFMAASVAMTVQKQKMWAELGISVPKQLQNILETTDVSSPETLTNEEVRKLLS